MLRHILIENPKQKSNIKLGKAAWYPFYAGFSASFASSLLRSSRLKKDAYIIDPWNGTGTTTSSAVALGYSAVGFDLNPVMVVIAKARLLNKREKTSLLPLASEIAKQALTNNEEIDNSDPLCIWFTTKSATNLRNIEKAIQRLLIDEQDYIVLKTQNEIGKLSSLAAFFYTALFRTTRSLMAQFIATNPTWVKKPKNDVERLAPSILDVLNAFKSEVRLQVHNLEDSDTNDSTEIFLASSDAIPINSNSVDFILTSPPYCTRIDYAVATMPELAILGINTRTDFESLRRKLMGTVTVPKLVPTLSAEWGKNCNLFMEQVLSHESKASQSYYYKNHAQYFDALFRSIQEVSRLLCAKGIFVAVVQDSHYKEIHNDLPQIFCEMAESNGLRLGKRSDFSQNQTMAGVNPKSKKYRKNFAATESVLCFVKS